VIVMGVGLRPTGKLLDEPPNPTTERAPHFYPDGAADKATSLARWKSSRRQLLDSDG
jgi:hypothetical protein